MPTAIVAMVYTLGHKRVKPCVERMPRAHTISSRPDTISTIQGQFIMAPDSLYREVLRAGRQVHIDALLSLSRAWRQRRPLVILSFRRWLCLPNPPGPSSCGSQSLSSTRHAPLGGWRSARTGLPAAGYGGAIRA